jgi:hypothetical protein
MSYTYDNLLAGSQKPLVNVSGTAALGQAWSRGYLVGLKTSTGKWQTVDFSDVADFDDFGVASEAVDSTEGEVVTSVFVEGQFNRDAVTIGYGDDYADWDITLRGHGIYLLAAVGTDGIDG